MSFPSPQILQLRGFGATLMTGLGCRNRIYSNMHERWFLRFFFLKKAPHDKCYTTCKTPERNDSRCNFVSLKPSSVPYSQIERPRSMEVYVFPCRMCARSEARWVRWQHCRRTAARPVRPQGQPLLLDFYKAFGFFIQPQLGCC